MGFKREHRYIVLKIADMNAALHEAERAILGTLLDRTEMHRHHQGKRPLRCVVVEHDWPEFEPTWKMIEDRVQQETLRAECARAGHDWQLMQVAGDGELCTRCGGWREEQL